MPERRRHLRRSLEREWLALTATLGVALAGCAGPGLGECDPAAAQELVFSSSGLVATKGQALAHDSCGNGAFCHSSDATGSARHAAPADMDFDMLPTPSGLDDLLERASAAWDVVEAGDMPPGEVGDQVRGDGQWSVDVSGLDAEAPRLPGLDSHAGKAAFRNWLACGAPAVTDTRVADWARAPQQGLEGTPGHAELHQQVLAPRCAVSGCHDDRSQAGGLVLLDACDSHAALLGAGACGKTYVVPGDPDASFLVEKLEQATPSCGGAMPPTGPLPETLRDAVRAWVAAGAVAEDCP